MDGFLELGLERRGEGTEVVMSRARAPFHYLPPARGERGAARLTIVNSSGGVLGGDRLATTVRLGTGAALSLRTQSATRVYRAAGGGAQAQQHFRLGRDARLEFLPDEIIPFAGSDYVQETTIELEPGAIAVLAEIASAGRLARDERFAFRRLAVALRCSIAGRLALYDRYDLEPARRRIDGAGILGGGSVWGSFYVLAAEPVAAALVEGVDRTFAAVPGGSGGATATPVGLVARAVAAGVEPIRTAIERARDLVAAATSSADRADLAQEKLLVYVAAIVARDRRARGLKLNHPESVALITAAILEGARDGRTVAELMTEGTTILARDDVMEGIAEMIDEIQVEATFPDGTKLVTVHHPIR